MGRNLRRERKTSDVSRRGMSVFLKSPQKQKEVEKKNQPSCLIIGVCLIQILSPNCPKLFSNIPFSTTSPLLSTHTNALLIPIGSPTPPPLGETSQSTARSLKSSFDPIMALRRPAICEILGTSSTHHLGSNSEEGAAEVRCFRESTRRSEVR